MNQTSNTWKFTRPFWTANIVELLERAAYYGMFIVVTLYLSREVGYNDIWAAWIAGGFSAGLYFLPPFSGAYADKIGFRKALLLAFGLLTIGYFGLGALPFKSTVIPSMLIVMVGGSFIKSVITGTVAKETSESNRARGFSIFYAMVNIGSFSGKTLVYPIRLELGLVYVNFLSAAFTLLALIGSSFSCYYIGFSNKVQYRCFTMVNMTHNRYNRRTPNQIFFLNLFNLFL